MPGALQHAVLTIQLHLQLMPCHMLETKCTEQHVLPLPRQTRSGVTRTLLAAVSCTKRVRTARCIAV
jgi:hypothetical protein